jgi:pimeloyl-ACP methyl ester carboxylesterase
VNERLIETAGLTQSILEDGSGPLVIFCHGFPELGFSWRRQLPVIANAGFHAVAPDMRGYGKSEKPKETEAYSILELVGDMVDLVQALGKTEAVIVGHDWGAPVAWHAALLRPDIFRAVAGFSVPFAARRAGRPPIETWKALSKAKGLGDFYMVRFQDPAVAAELDADVEGALRRMIWAYDGSTPDAERSTGFLPEGVGFSDAMPKPKRLPPWLDESELAHYVHTFEHSGFSGPLSWYRNIDRNFALTAFARDRRVEVPALFVVGEKDPVRLYTAKAAAELSHWAPKLTANEVIRGAGHWLQQERPQEINALLLSFLRGLPA